ncbi:hypothetical protein GJU41_17825 [Bacillus idriensis]|uniref:Threonine dehydratase n=2 Tax=Metabacillus idriensis TaxID=324768 RepID=A0A6I2MBP3_9BACI|nr:hypothetical protein [Metabacillus idriensis]MRX55825.1 hypothetical protein [Metabacillus idriensis]
MEFELKSAGGALPCLVVADEDNGRFMIRKEDTSGEVFNSAHELTQWIRENWSEEQFENPSQFLRLLEQLKRD